MSSIGGPNIVERGLVLSYDVANTTLFRGEPTTNLFGGNFRDFTGTGYSLDGEWPGTTVTKTYFPNLPTPIGPGATLMTESTVSGIQGLTRYGGGSESGEHSLSAFIYPLTSNITEFTIGLLGDAGNMIYFNLVTGLITYGGGITNRNSILEPVPFYPGWYRIGANFEGRAGGWVGSIGYSMQNSYAGSGVLRSMYITGIQYEYKTYPTPFTIGTRGINVLNGGGIINQSKINSNNGTISNPFASPEEAQKFGYPAGNYYFKSGSMSSAELLEYSPNYYEGKPFCCVFRSPYRSTATTNKIDLNIPMGGLLVQRDTLDLRAAVYWTAPISYNTVGSTGNNTANSGNSSRRVILGFGGGHGIFSNSQSQCNWSNATGAIGAGWDGSTCGSFPNDLVWGTGRSDTATYDNRSGIWSHWVTWTDFNGSGELVNGVTFNSNNLGSLVFDGVNDYVTIPTFTNKPLTQISCECWMRPNKPSIGGTIRGGGISSTNSMYLGIIDSVDGGNTFAMHWANQTTNSRLFNWNGSIPNNQWSHLIGTYDGSMMSAYLNGVEIYSVAQTGTIPDATYVVRTYGLTLTDVTHNFHGRISGVKIYNVGLTASEVLQNYNATKGRFGL